MSFENSLGWAGLVLTLLTLAAAYLCPTKKWIGWVACSLAGILVAGWVFLAFGSLLGVLAAEFILVVATVIAFRLASRPKSNSAPALLTVEHPRIKPTAVEYGDQRQRLYIGHIAVRNPRSDAAPNCEIRLVKIGEKPSHDTKPLKVTETKNSYAQSISSTVPGTFDLFGITEGSFPSTYLLTNADVSISPLLSTPEIHFLTYEISATGFQTITAKIGLDLSGNPPPTNPDTTKYAGSGASVTTWVTASPMVAESDPIDAPLKWDPTPRVWIVEQGPA